MIRRGTVYGTLNELPRRTRRPGRADGPAALQGAAGGARAVHQAGHTWTENGGAIPVPAHVPEVEIGATIAGGMNGREIAGFVLMNDLSIPHDNFFRPRSKFKCLDGFLGIGDRVRARNEAGDPAVFKLEVRINGELKQTVRFRSWLRPAEKLLADVSEFMSLAEGDMLALGCDRGRPRARVGDRIETACPRWAP